MAARPQKSQNCSFQKRKIPPFGGTFLHSHVRPASFDAELATTLALLVGVLALTVRILLLLSGFLAATLLLAGLLARILVLLARLLTRVLVLLARILVRVGHRDLPC
jgi:hypothetical protein